MAVTFPDQDQYPFNAVVYIEVTWDDGGRSRGSGTLIGLNDVLTAAHVVYEPGRTAKDIDIYPAWDGSPGPWGAFTGEGWQANYVPITYTSDGKLTQSASANDVAVIGLSDTIGARTGYLDIAPNAGSGTYDVLGYPVAQGSRLTEDEGSVTYGNGVYQIGGLYHAPGSSGGPLLNAAHQVVGVISTELWAARIDSEWSTIHGWMVANDALIATPAAEAPPAFSVLDRATGQTTMVTAQAYSGPVAHLQYQYVGTAGDEAIGGTTRDDFINASGGTDAVDAGAGNDVVDGGTGSNFLAGGAGADAFFLDGRGGGTTWSTITDWQAGEQLSLWGYQPGRSVLSWEENAGAEGFRGLTLHGDLDGDGAAETSVTWAGLSSQAQLPNPQALANLLWFV